MRHALIASLFALAILPPPAAQAADETPSASAQDILAASRPTEWRRVAPDNLLVMQLPTGRVLIELAPAFTPRHAANIRTLAREHYFDGLSILRVQDNFVTQWGDPNEDDPVEHSAKSLGTAAATLPAEFTRPIDPKLAWTPLPDGDTYAPEVGFSDGFPAARDPATNETWLAHCYGMVGVARDTGPETGNGSALYAVIGQAPRRLDRNLAVAGRVIEGMPLLAGLPRGAPPMGFYAAPAQRISIQSLRLASTLPAAEQPRIEVLRTDSPSFAALVEARRNTRNAFYTRPAGHIDLCSIDIPAREVPHQPPATQH